MGKRVIVTKDKIIKYLKMYKNLNNIIKNRELRWIIEKGPSFQEWERGKNTVEAQAIKLIEDKKLNELKFYKENLNKYIFILKSTYEKEYYKYIVYRYIKNYSKEKIKKELPTCNIYEIEQEIIEYLYINLVKESRYSEK